MEQITNWLQPEVISQTMYGWITDAKWLVCEKERFESRGYDCAIKQAVDTRGPVAALFCSKQKKQKVLDSNIKSA